MDRRTFLTVTGVTAAGGMMPAAAPAEPAPGSAGIASPALPRQPPALRLAAGGPTACPIYSRLADRLSRGLRVALAGRYVILAEGEEPDLVLGCAWRRPLRDPAFAFFAGLPLDHGLDGCAHQAWLAAGGGQMLWDDLGAAFGVKPLLVGHTGPTSGLWAARRLDHPADFAGARLCLEGPARDVVARLGAVPEEMPADEAPGAALQRGAIAGAEWASALAACAAGLPPAAVVRYPSGIQTAGLAITLEVSLVRWDRMDEADRLIIEAVTARELALTTAERHGHEAVARDLLAATTDVPEEPWSASVSAALSAAASEMVANAARSSAEAGRIAASHRAFRTLLSRETAPARPAFSS